MSLQLLFITRKWEGVGGMQRLARDLWRGMEGRYGGRARLCAPLYLSHTPLLFRSLLRGVAAACAGHHIHLLDATLAPLGWFFKKVGRGRVTITVCGLDVVWKPRWYQWMLRKTLPRLDRVVCISHATAEEVRKRGVSEERVVVIPCGVTVGQGYPCPTVTGIPLSYNSHAPLSYSSSPLLLSLCRLVPRKGICWFVSEVLPLLVGEYPSIKYLVIGSGTEEKLIKKIVQEKGLEGHVRLCGNVGEEQLHELLSSADLLIVPNIRREGDMEGFGIACIEASSRGVPVVAAHIEGLQDAVIEGVTGRFFASGNAQSCARVIREMLEKPFERFRVSSAILEKFDWAKLMERYEEEVFVTVGEEYSSPTVGIVTWDYEGEGKVPKGGMGRAMAGMVEVMKEQKIEVTVLTPQKIRNPNIEIRNNDNNLKLQCSKCFSYWNLCHSNLFRISCFVLRISLVGQRILFSLFLPFTLQKWIDRNDIQILLVPTGPGGLFLFKKPKRCRLHVVSYHTYAQQSSLVPGEKWKRVFVPFERRTLKMADSVLCYAEDTRKILGREYGLGYSASHPCHAERRRSIPKRCAAWPFDYASVQGLPSALRLRLEERALQDLERQGEMRPITLLPQILDVERWEPKEPVQKERGLCVCVGRLEPRKGIAVLLEAWKHILQMYRCTGTSVHHPHLVIVGDGVLRRKVRSFITRLPPIALPAGRSWCEGWAEGGHSSVRWIHVLPQGELITLIQKAELCICPSYLEGFGLAAAEAMAAGTAVIASDTDGLRSLIRHGETGWLVPPGDPKALTEATTELLRNRELRKALARRAQEETQKRFDREKAVSALIRSIEQGHPSPLSSPAGRG